MASFRLTNGTGGCPPTGTPPADYEIPFRFDPSGNLYITDCFASFKFFGLARHDISTEVVIGTATAPLNTDGDILAGSGVTAGTYNPLNITNTTECDMGLLVGYDMNVDCDILGSNMAKFILTGRFNGTLIDSIAASSTRVLGSATYNRAIIGNAANAHDPAIEAGGAPGLTLAAGATCTVSARFFIQYAEGAPAGTPGTDRIVQAGSAVRVYGYCL